MTVPLLHHETLPWHCAQQGSIRLAGRAQSKMHSVASVPPHSGRVRPGRPTDEQASRTHSQSCRPASLCTMAAYCAPRFRLLADLHAARLLAGACSLAVQQQSQHACSSWHPAALLLPPLGPSRHRCLSTSTAACAAARAGDIEGDLIAPDVGLARIDGCVAPTAQRAALGSRAACGAASPAARRMFAGSARPGSV